MRLITFELMIFLVFSIFFLTVFLFRRTLVRLLFPWLLQKLVKKAFDQQKSTTQNRSQSSKKNPPQNHSYAEDIEFEELDD